MRSGNKHDEYLMQVDGSSDGKDMVRARALAHQRQLFGSGEAPGTAEPYASIYDFKLQIVQPVACNDNLEARPRIIHTWNHRRHGRERQNSV